MVERIRALYEDYAAEFQSLEQKRRAGAGMFGLTDGPRNYAVYWMLGAVHGKTMGLISRLTPESAGRLLARYEGAYPRREQLPVQKKVAAALKKRAKQ